MLSRALSLATVLLLIGCFATVPARAQNLEAGKAPSQIFSGTCTVCHKSPRGLLKTVTPGALPGFLRQHYTTSSDMASSLSAYLISNGATDTRYGVGLTKQGKESQTEPKKPEAAPEQAEAPRGRKPRGAPEEVSKPDADGLAASDPAGRHGRNAKRLARPGAEPTDARPATEAQTPATATEAGADGKPLSGKQKLSKRGKRLHDEPKTDSAKTDAPKDEPAKSEAVKDDRPKGETAKSEPSKVEEPRPAAAAAKPSDESKAEPAKSEAVKSEPARTEPPALRADPVPAVTPAPKAAEKPADSESQPAVVAAPAPVPAPPAAAASPPPVSAAAEPASAPKPAPSPAVQASAPPAAPAGPPAPPISQ